MPSSLTRSKACWACRRKYQQFNPLTFAKTVEVSKVRCDLSTPTCSNCVRAGKTCQYGLRLSWPREGDARRSIVARHESYRKPTVLPENGHIAHFLNAGYPDVRLYFILSSGNTHKDRLHILGASKLPNSISDSIPKALSWIASGSGKFEEILMSHCKNENASLSQSTNLFR